MAVILYKKGNMGKVRGIPCQIQVCNEFSYLHLLDEGWFYTVEEMLEAEKAAEKAAIPAKIAAAQAKKEKKVQAQAKAKEKEEIVVDWDKDKD